MKANEWLDAMRLAIASMEIREIIAVLVVVANELDKRHHDPIAELEKLRKERG